jgi:aminoglycoside phosphotransferase (APT) family kinase protein
MSHSHDRSQPEPHTDGDVPSGGELAHGEYETWRNAWHAAMRSTDLQLLGGIVVAATGDTVVQWERIIGGEVNEVHAATLAGGRQVVVRVSRAGPGCRFEAERWAIRAAAAVGVPVPNVLAIERTQDQYGALAVCVEERVPGRPLEAIDDPAARRRLSGLAGEIVAALHTIAMPGCGFVRPDGTLPVATWAPVMRLSRLDPPLHELIRLGHAHDIPGPWIEAAATELDGYDDLFASVQHRLLHGDLSANHVFTDGTRITGLIDLEQAFAGDPAFEFVRWDYFREATPLSWLRAGYERVAHLGPDADLRMRLGRLRLHLALLSFHTPGVHPIAIAQVRRRFEEDVHWFGFEHRPRKP